MRGDEELSALCCAHKQLRNRLEEIWVKACLGFVQGEQRRRARAQQHREQAKVAEGPIGELPRIEVARDSRHLHGQAEPTLGRFDLDGRTRKCELYAALQCSPISDLDDRLQRSGKIAAVVELAFPGSSIQVEAGN